VICPNYRMRRWVWEGVQSLYKDRNRTQEQALRELLPFVESLTWDDLKCKTRMLLIPKETEEALRNKVKEIEQAGKKTTILAVLRCAVSKMREAEAANPVSPV